MYPYIDIHSHSSQPQSDMVSVRCINPYTQPFFDSEDFFSVGLHPWNLPDIHKDWYVRFIRKIVRHDKCLAVGECGLDYIVQREFGVQEKFFMEHIQISEQFNIPLIIHCVKAFHELLNIHKKINPKSVWIIHGFEKSKETAKQCLDAGMFLSVGKKALDSKYSEVLRYIPADKLFAETDDSEICIMDVYEAFANAKQMRTEDLKIQLYENFSHCFSKFNLS